MSGSLGRKTGTTEHGDWPELEGMKMDAGRGEKPTRYRWFVLFLLCLMYLITYMDRVNISAAAPLISKEFGFNKITMGIIFSAFTWGYAALQIPGGWMGD